MKTTQTNRLPAGFWWHNGTQFCGAMNDNIFKLLIVYALIAWNGSAASASILATVGLVFALPFILIIPFAGILADKFSKRTIIIRLKLFEIAVMSFGAFALSQQNETMLYLTMFLMSSQSALFGPCKYGILREIVPNEALSKANGALQLLTYLAIICGTVIAPQLSILIDGQFGLAGLLCISVSVCGFLFSTQTTTPRRANTPNKPTSILSGVKCVLADSALKTTLCALALFSMSAAYIQLNVIDYGSQTLGISPEVATRLFLLTAIGIGLGSFSAGRISGRYIEFGIVPIGVSIMAISLFLIGIWNTPNVYAVATCMLTLGFASGLYIVPLETFVQQRSPSACIGSIQAVSGFTSWIGILLASQLIILNSQVLNLTAQQGFLILSIGLALLALFAYCKLFDFFVKLLVQGFTKIGFKLRILGDHNLPTTGPALLVCNHVSLLDAIVIQSSNARRVRMLMSRKVYNESNWITRKIVDLAQAILIQDTDGPKQLIKSLQQARKALDEGYLVCIFAEGALTRSGILRPFKQGFERIVKNSDYPIIPMHIEGVWNTVGSFKNGTAKLNPLADLGTRISLIYGQPQPADSTAYTVRQAISELSVQASELKKEHRTSLNHEFIRSARSNWSQTAIHDSSGKSLTYGELLTVSLILRKRLSTCIVADENKIGILLPTGAGAAIANLSVSMSNKIPVNLNFTAPHQSVQSALKQCSIRTVLTSRKFLSKIPEQPLPENCLYLEDLLQNIRKSEKFQYVTAARLTPTNFVLRKQLRNPEKIATVLFSSGSTNEPKGIQLSHNNILSNIESFRDVLMPKPDDCMLATLPLFHSFGYTVTFWFPLISGMTICTHPNPLEAPQIGELAQKHKASILLTTPSFLLNYIRKVKPEQFAHLRYVFTGAEKLQPRVADLFEKRFSIRPLQGYGATELSPVCAINLPDVYEDGELQETGNRPGTVGRVLPGMTVKIIDPDTQQELPYGQAGLIWIKGTNVMSGYLNNLALTQKTIQDGWYNTGDIGSLDPDGFISITGRLSRFAKIAGEMVSLTAIEEHLQEAFQLEPNQLAVLSLSDERKGEKLFVISTPIDESQTPKTETLKQIDMPNLWKPAPKNWNEVPELPLLGSGKVDYRTLQAHNN